MVNKPDCSFWLEGRCRFSDEDCRKTHNPNKKGTKQTVTKRNNQAVFQIAQIQSPPPGLVRQQTSALGLEDEEGWITPMSKQKMRKMKVAARRLGGDQQAAPQLDEQTTQTSHLTGGVSHLVGPVTQTCPLDGELNRTQTPQQSLLQVVQTLHQTHPSQVEQSCQPMMNGAGTPTSPLNGGLNQTTPTCPLDGDLVVVPQQMLLLAIQALVQQIGASL